MMKILWVEDNADVYEDRRREMENHGCVVEVSPHIEHFRQRYLDQLAEYDAVILDVLFDDVEYANRYLGLEILALIRARDPSLPVILWTVVGDQARAEIKQVCGADAYTKVFMRNKFEELLAYLDSMEPRHVH